VDSEVALETRNDHVDVALYRQVRRNRFFAVNRVGAGVHSVSGFTRHLVELEDWVRFELGLRGDLAFFDVDDRLPVQTGDAQFAAELIRGNENDALVSPKVNVIFGPWSNTEVYLNFGTGFHSNDARAAVSQGADPLVQSIGYEIGSRSRQFGRLDLAAALWLLDLDSELVFSGDAGTVEPSPGSRRWGIDFETRLRAADWLFLDYDLSYTDPRFRASGGAVPLAPTLIMNGGLTAELDNGFSAALRIRFVDDRPADEDRTLYASGYTLLDLLARYRWRNVEATLDFLNLLDRDWREAQFEDTSCVRGELGSAPGCSPLGNLGTNVDDVVPDIHFTPGNPFWLRGGITVYF
jgi:outer membrane receptor protein involved in Fe transport